MHGELVHRSAEPARSVAHAPRARGVVAADNGSSDGGGEHEHCDARAVRFDAPALFVHAIEPVRVLSFLDWRVDAPEATRPSDVLSLAPKTSPPAA